MATKKVKPQPAVDGFILDNHCILPPEGLIVRNFTHEPWIKSEFVKQRKLPVTQLVIHRGAESTVNAAKKTKAVLDNRKLSTLFTVDNDGVVYQHYDPSNLRGLHCSFHNVQSDSIDVAGVFTKANKAALDSQRLQTLDVAIGKSKNYNNPEKRNMVRFQFWSLTPEQEVALNLLIPFWCDLRNIPKTIYTEHRSCRVGNLGINDPITDVRGVFSHCQLSNPGSRVDGIEVVDLLSKRTDFAQVRTFEEFLGTR